MIYNSRLEFGTMFKAYPNLRTDELLSELCAAQQKLLLDVTRLLLKNDSKWSTTPTFVISRIWDDNQFYFWLAIDGMYTATEKQK